MIISIIMLAVYRSFASGLGAWGKTEAELGALAEGRSFLSNLASELRSAVLLDLSEGAPSFQAGAGKLTFFTTSRLSDRSLNPGLAVTKVTYEIVKSEDQNSSVGELKVKRGRQFYSGSRPIGEAEGAVVLSGIKAVKFSYLSKEAVPGRMKWQGNWKSGKELPRAVRIRLVLEAPSLAPGKKQQIHFGTTVALQVRGKEA